MRKSNYYFFKLYKYFQLMISIIKYYFMVLRLVFKHVLYAIHIIIRRHVSIDEPVKELLTTRTISINERARCKYLYQMSITVAALLNL